MTEQQKEDTITLVLEMGDESTEVELTMKEFQDIVWHAGRANMEVESFINEVLKQEINKMEENEEGEE